MMAKLLTKHASQNNLLAGTKAYAELRKAIVKAGILDRSYRYYSLLIVFSLSGFFLSFYNLYLAQSTNMLIFWGVLFACFAVQLGGLMHDAGHRSIFATSRMNDIFGHIFSGLLGMPFGEWKTVHNKHHAHPNEEEEDPDIELPLVSLTRERYLARKGLSKLLRPYQMYLWYPVGSLVSFMKRFYAIKYFRREFRKGIFWEVLLYGAGLFVWLVLPFLLFDITKALTIFLVTNLTLGFYLANIFAPNHKGMPMLKKGMKLSFIEQQVMTARNIYGHWLTDFIYMGLNYQIEHHLFPNCPRNKLYKITPYLLEICRKMKLEYTQVSILESNRIILGELKKISATSKS